MPTTYTIRRPSDAAATSWIAQERERPGRPAWWFVLVAALLGAAVAAVCIIFGATRGEILAAESMHAVSERPYGMLHELFRLDAMRVLSGLAAGLAVVSVAFVGRRLTHSSFVGFLAAALCALDPALLLEGQIATPESLLRLFALMAVALALGEGRHWHWLVIIPMAAGSILDFRFIIWAAPVGAVLLLRGHIYGAPKHLAGAALQVVAIPAGIAFAVHAIASAAGTPVYVECARTGMDALLFRSLPSYGNLAVAIPNPVTWFGGLGTLLALAGASIWQVGGNFRMTRSPGRVQFRLPRSPGRLAGRSGWLLAFMLAAPFPGIWLPLGALALAVGVHHLMKDSFGFGATIGAVLMLFAIIYLVRFAALVGGDIDAEGLQQLLSYTPWSATTGCTTP